ncbi:LamB/YcsF family protein [Thioclava sp. BHET1]|nr:LamB/YcsF family protein [Thioclava sp. BHET1]
MKVDLNADIGESFGPWVMGDDAALTEVITSANIACGAHAGDPDVMAASMARAQSHNLGLGAHPGFADRQGFGRRRIPMAPSEIANMITYQLGAAIAMARAAGGTLRHVKLHGALSNMAAEDLALARHCYESVLKVDPDLILVAQSATALEEAARALDCNWAGEIFADRAYNDDGTLVSRAEPGAVLHDPGEIATRITEMLREGAIITRSGKRIACRIDTICVHGDTPGAVQTARALRDALTAEGIALERF